MREEREGAECYKTYNGNKFDLLETPELKATLDIRTLPQGLTFSINP